MGLVSQKARDPYDATPNTWFPFRAGERWSATWTCPNGHEGTLLDHEIAPDGTVSPSVVCNGYPEGDRHRPASPCTFHDYLKLDGWNAQA